MKELKGTKTEKNLETAFAGESMARNKYDYWASKAKKDGYQQIAAIFAETALNDTCRAVPSGPQKRICSRLPKARTTNGQRCIRHSRKKQMRKASQRSLSSSEALPGSKKNTKSVIRSFSAI